MYFIIIFNKYFILIKKVIFKIQINNFLKLKYKKFLKILQYVIVLRYRTKRRGRIFWRFR